MPIGGLGFWEILLIFVVLLLVFGAKRLPELGGALGKGIREFKSSVRDLEGELKRPVEDATREVRPADRNAALSGGEPARPKEAEKREEARQQ